MATAKEIIMQAVAKEEEAYQMYSKGAEMTKTKSTKELFLMLANEEKKHKVALEKVDANSTDLKFVAGEYNKFAKSLMMTPMNELAEVKSLFEKAIKQEQDAYDLYGSFSSASMGSIKKLFLTLSNQEAMHKKLLMAEYRKCFG